jgi:CheY-like chemotaxis protein
MPAEKGRDIPAVALSAYTRPEDKARALKSGFQACLSKPLDAEELLQCIVRLTRR